MAHLAQLLHQLDGVSVGVLDEVEPQGGVGGHGLGDGNTGSGQLVQELAHVVRGEAHGDALAGVFGGRLAGGDQLQLGALVGPCRARDRS